MKRPDGIINEVRDCSFFLTAALIRLIGVGIFNAFFNIYFIENGSSENFLGVFLAVGNAAMALASYPIGVLIDRISKKKLLILVYADQSRLLRRSNISDQPCGPACHFRHFRYILYRFRQCNRAVPVRLFGNRRESQLVRYLSNRSYYRGYGRRRISRKASIGRLRRPGNPDPLAGSRRDFNHPAVTHALPAAYAVIRPGREKSVPNSGFRSRRIP